ncbi:Scr1 family TA system antitoxin-like transcriptional regulator [Streptomyces sp. NPDC001046]|uniref:Scr1 family TA system antitoxin-like transcriptional regulator n=1 Tax=Streptomyces sp. NPDC001046 TaxID=3364543 RepID=UPI00367BCD69
MAPGAGSSRAGTGACRRSPSADREHDADPGPRGLPVPGLFQTPEYTRVIFESNADFRTIPPSTEAAVEARMRRQERRMTSRSRSGSPSAKWPSTTAPACRGDG